MAGALDRTLPGVYVDIEDRSETAATIQTGRSAYVVIISDRGPHNKIVELNSNDDLYDLFGRPDFSKFGQGHYLASNHLKWSNKLYVCRIAMMTPFGDSEYDDCMAISNSYININNDSTSKLIEGNDVVIPAISQLQEGNFKFSLNSNKIAVDQDSYPLFDVGDYIYMDGSESKNALKIISKDNITNTFTLENNYLGMSNSITTNSYLIIPPKNEKTTYTLSWDADSPLARYTGTSTEFAQMGLKVGDIIYPEEVYVDGSTTQPSESVTVVYIDTGALEVQLSADLSSVFGANSGLTPSILCKFSPAGQVIRNGNFTFTYNSNLLVADQYVISTFKVGDWVYPSNAAPADARQITSIDTLNYRYLLDSEYVGAISKYANAYKFIPSIEIAGPKFSFAQNNNIISTNIESLRDITVGTWVYPEDETSSIARQIIEIDEKKSQLVLDAPYTGPDYLNVNMKEYLPFSIKTVENMRTVKDADSLNVNTLWYFVARGAGAYYNRYFIRGVRNFTMERVQMDKNANQSLYPYGFMDIAIYRQNDDYTTTLMEGPWTVSLFSKYTTNQLVTDPYTGMELYLPTVINRRSKLIQVVEGKGLDIVGKVGSVVPNDSEIKARMHIQNLFYSGQSINTSDAEKIGLQLFSGFDGTLFDAAGNLNLSDPYRALIGQAYAGTLQSLDDDDSVENIIHDINPAYQFDYVYCGNYGTMVNNSAKELVDIRDDCLLLTDTGSMTVSSAEDVQIRQNAMNWNTYNAGIYTQYKEIEDTFTAKRFFVSPVYHAIDRHLYTDARYWISEPVAGIEKGAILDSTNLAYMPKRSALTDNYNNELNSTIREPDGIYMITQFTTWKRESMLKRMHVVKFVHYLKKQIPTLLKDLLQKKGSAYIISQAEQRVNNFMEPFVDTGEGSNYGSISTYNSAVSFDELRSEMNIKLTIRPLRAVERINVSIIVE
jgi:hypothetical protein